MELKTIAHIHTDFPEKFGLPRQSGLIEELNKNVSRFERIGKYNIISSTQMLK